MFEDPLDDTRLGDEGDHAEFATARTKKWVEFLFESDLPTDDAKPVFGRGSG